LAARRDSGADVHRCGCDRRSVAWPGSSSGYAVPVNRIEIPVVLGLLALLPLLVRRSCGPVRRGRVERPVRVVGYLVVLAVMTGHAVEYREGQKLGAYFGHGMVACRWRESLAASRLCSPPPPRRS
jgi:hypothetical protein